MMFWVPGQVLAQTETSLENQPPAQEFSTAIIKSLEMVSGDEMDPSAQSTGTAEIVSGPEKGKVVTISLPSGTGAAYLPTMGEKIVITKVQGYSGDLYYFSDRYRVPSLLWILAIFLVLTVAMGRWRGVTSLLGLAGSIAIIVFYVVPRILAGDSPVVVSIIGSIFILFISIYLAHGFHWRTSVAVVSTAITLTLSALLATWFVHMANLFGLGSEEVLSLQITQLGNINFRGLLLGGMILGALGVLDDITTAQSAAVEELKRANLQFSFWELYKRAMSIGKEHISSLVNTLFLAYAGVSLPLFLFFTVMPQVPAWVHLNSEFIADELVRTLAGSITLMLAVPITTLLATFVFTRKAWLQHLQLDKSV